MAQTVFSILAVSTCLGLLVRFSGQANLILVGAIVVVEGVAVLVILNGAMVSVYLQSEETLAKIQWFASNWLKGIKLRWARRFLKSCDKIKIKFGSHNFLDAKTLIRCLDASINLALQVLLLSGSK